MWRRTVLQGLAATATLSTPAIARTLRFVPQSNLPTLDPLFSSEVVANHGFHVFDTLYAADSKGVVQPQMAAGHRVSDDGRTWRIRLRDGLKFHDDAPVRAADCAASLERWSRLDTFGRLLAKAVERWGAPDDRTVEIRLTRPFPLLLDAIGKAQSQVAFMLPIVPLGQWFGRTAYRRSITGVLPGGAPYPWNVRPA